MSGDYLLATNKLYRKHVSNKPWIVSKHTKGLFILAGAKTDWFSDPAGNYAKDNAPCALVTLPDDAFLLSAKVSVEFASAFDAGVLQIRATDDRWAKLCFEYSPQRRPMIVSVVTRGVKAAAGLIGLPGIGDRFHSS
jgi:Uncharacterized conserved protein